MSSLRDRHTHYASTAVWNYRMDKLVVEYHAWLVLLAISAVISIVWGLIAHTWWAATPTVINAVLALRAWQRVRSWRSKRP